MKIPNYDTNKSESKERKLNDFIGEDYHMLICGQSNCGKTNVLMHMLRKPLIYYDKIYLYTPNQHQNKIKDFSKIMDTISKKVGYGVLEIKGLDDILDTGDYQKNNRKIVIFDDAIAINAPEKVQRKIANHFTDGRHNSMSSIYISQSYYDTIQKIRHNCSHMLLYQPTTKNHCNLIAKENMFKPSLFEKLKPYEFIFVDKEKKTVKKNLMNLSN